MVIISDANVIVYFWKAGLLEKLHGSAQTIVPERIFNELTQGRIKYSYPELADLINQHRYNPQIENPIRVDVIEHVELQTIAMHEYIKTDSGLDEGEIDGIMLSVLSGQPFVTNYSQAIEFFNEVLDHSSAGKAQGFEAFLDDFLGNGYIDRAEHRLLLEEKTK